MDTTTTKPVTISRIWADFGVKCVMASDEGAPLPFAVWSLDESHEREDVIGSGRTESEALNDAAATLRGWVLR